MKPTLERLTDPAAVVGRAAELVAETVLAIPPERRIAVALSGGNTPQALYRLLTDPGEKYLGRLPWSRLHFFLGDERYVPSDHADSNFRMLGDSLFGRAPIPEANIHRVRTELAPPEICAHDYHRQLAVFFDGKPALDLALLGLGSDAHTASLFPGVGLPATGAYAAALWVEKLGMYRITLLPTVFNAARSVLLLATGKEKAPAVRAVLEGPRDPASFPAQLIEPTAGKYRWLIDEAAALELAPK